MAYSSEFTKKLTANEVKNNTNYSSGFTGSLLNNSSTSGFKVYKAKEPENKDIWSTLGYVVKEIAKGGSRALEGIAQAGGVALKGVDEAINWLVNSFKQQNPIAGNVIFGQEKETKPFSFAYQQYEPSVSYVKDPNTGELVEKKTGYGERTVTSALFDNLDKSLNEKSLIDPNSFLGQLPSQVGSVVSLATTGGIPSLMISAAGNSYTQAKQNGGSELESLSYGLTSGIIEGATEKLFGGLGKAFGKGALDDLVVGNLTKKISNSIAKKLTQIGIKSVGEGIEEIAGDLVYPLIQKATYASEETLGKLYKDQNMLKDFLTGMAVSGILQGASFNNMQVVGKDTSADKMVQDFIELGKTDNIDKLKSIVENNLDKLSIEQVQQFSRSLNDNKLVEKKQNMSEPTANQPTTTQSSATEIAIPTANKKNISPQDDYEKWAKSVSKNDNELANELLFKNYNFDYEAPKAENDIRMYHGTDWSSYDELSLQKFNQTTMDRNYGDYFYLTTDKSFANVYGNNIAQFNIPKDKILKLEDYRKNFKNVPDEKLFEKYWALEMPNSEYIVKNIEEIKKYTKDYVINNVKPKASEESSLNTITQPNYMWHSASKNNIDLIRQYGFRYDKDSSYFATNYDTSKNYGEDRIMLDQNNFKIKDVTLELKNNNDNREQSRNNAVKEGYDGIKYKTSNSNYDVEITNIDKLNNVVQETEKDNKELEKILLGEQLIQPIVNVAKNGIETQNNAINEVKNLVEGTTKGRKYLDTILDSPFTGETTKQVIENEIGAIFQNYQVKTNKETLQKANNRIRVDGIENTVNAIESKVDNGQKLETEDIAALQKIAIEAESNKDMATISRIVPILAVVSTDTGQLLQSLSLIQKMSPTGRLLTLEKLIKRENNKPYNVKKGATAVLSDELKNAIISAQSQNELDLLVNKALIEISNQYPVTVGDKLRSWRYLSMLGNPRTHIRNILSNVAMSGTARVKNRVAGLIEDITIKDGQPRERTFKNASKDVKDFAKKDAVKMQNIIQGEGKYDIKNKYKISQRSFDSEFMNWLAGGNSKALNFEDWLFSSQAYKRALASYITANKLTVDYLESGTREALNDLEKGRQVAIKEAQEQTFRQFSKLANAISQFEENTNIVGKIAVGAVLPFKKTPINIVKTGVQYSPLNLVRGIAQTITSVKKGDITINEAVNNIAKGLTGSSIMAIGYVLAQSGILTGSGSDDDKKTAFDKMTGWQPYSIKIGSKTYTLDWLSPIAMPLFVGVELFNSKKEDANFDLWQLIDSLGSIVDPLTEMSMLQGLNKTLQTYNSDGILGTVGAIGQQAVQNYVGQFIPTLSGQVARTVDQTRRDTTGTGKGLEKTATKFVNQQVAKIPFLSKVLPAYTDAYGREQSLDNVGLSVFQQFLSPGYISTQEKTSVDKQINDLYSKLPEEDRKSIVPSLPVRYFTVSGEKIELTSAEYEKYNKTRGETMYNSLNKLFKSSYYKNASDGDKSAMIQDIYTYSNTLAKEKYCDENDIDYSKSLEVSNYLQWLGIDAETYSVYNSGQSLAEGVKNIKGETISGSKKKAEIKAISEIDNTTVEEKLLLIYMAGNSIYDGDIKGISERDARTRVANYVNNLSITLEKRELLFDRLGYKVKNGKVSW